MVSEKCIENQIIHYLNAHPCVFVFKINTVGIYDPIKRVYRTPSANVVKGTSDILGIAYGKFIAIEVKTPKTIKPFLKSSKERDLRQKAFIAKINDMGGAGLIASSLEDVIPWLERLKH